MVLSSCSTPPGSSLPAKRIPVPDISDSERPYGLPPVGKLDVVFVDLVRR
jgi:hypothetical protein